MGAWNSKEVYSYDDVQQRVRDVLPGIKAYKLCETIGTGAFGEVKRGIHIETGLDVAVKLLDKTKLNKRGIEMLEREVSAMKWLQHDNIVTLYQAIDTEDTTYIIMEYVRGGTLRKHLEKAGGLNEDEAREKFRQIVLAVQYMHSRKIVHRDLKTTNMMLDICGKIKLVDFGLGRDVLFANQLTTTCGTPLYMAPELFRSSPYTGEPVDVWSLGIILYELLTAKWPFDGAIGGPLEEKVTSVVHSLPAHLSAECTTLLKRLLEPSAEKRPTLVAIVHDSWVGLNPQLPISPPMSKYEIVDRLVDGGIAMFLRNNSNDPIAQKACTTPELRDQIRAKNLIELTVAEEKLAMAKHALEEMNKISARLDEMDDALNSILEQNESAGETATNRPAMEALVAEASALLERARELIQSL